MSNTNLVQTPELVDARAPSVPLQVVAAKVPRVCIVRAFAQFVRPEEMIEEVQRYVGQLRDDVEWTAHRYEGRPSWWHQITGQTPYGGGVYRWNYSGDGYQGRDSNCYRELVGLLHVPCGWAAIKPLRCENCGKTMAEHDALAQCYGTERGTDLAEVGLTDSGAT